MSITSCQDRLRTRCQDYSRLDRCSARSLVENALRVASGIRSRFPNPGEHVSAACDMAGRAFTAGNVHVVPVNAAEPIGRRRPGLAAEIDAGARAAYYT